MKTHEKLILLLFLPFAYIWHYIKIAGKFLKRFIKPLIVILIVVAMLLVGLKMKVFAF